MKAGMIVLIIIIAMIVVFMIVGLIWDQKAKTYDLDDHTIDEYDEEEEVESNDKIYYD